MTCENNYSECFRMSLTAKQSVHNMCHLMRGKTRRQKSLHGLLSMRPGQDSRMDPSQLLGHLTLKFAPPLQSDPTGRHLQLFPGLLSVFASPKASGVGWKEILEFHPLSLWGRGAGSVFFNRNINLALLLFSLSRGEGRKECPHRASGAIVGSNRLSALKFKIFCLHCCLPRINLA